jgi:carboxypeptidase PM20D1
MPATSEIVVNFRILPGNTVEDVIKHVERCCKGMEAEIEVVSGSEASAISETGARGYQVMKNAISKIYPGSIITPFVSVIGTDSRKYEPVCRNIYRFLPVRLNEAEQQSIHGMNEYISIENYRKMIEYFKEVMAAEF